MEKVPKKQKRAKNASKEELLNLTKEELADRIIQLEIHNYNLKNIINKSCSETSKTQKESKKRTFDFNKANYRHVLLNIMYFGWEYQGFVVQEDTPQTIEHHLFTALIKACLVESRETSNYHRCGRTDKGVSAYGQVVSILLRSKHTPDKQNEPESIADELQYCKMLNRLLPRHIRAVGWMPIPNDKPEFSARFDCKKRQYKYYFPRSSLDIHAMREACALLTGNHDFRNFCKMDVGNGVTEFRRTILHADVKPVDNNDVDKPTSMYYLLIEGNAFLWHQIRCSMAVLLLVGERRENKDVITQLFDCQAYPRKPQYHMAIDVPLNLFKCSYDLQSDWVYEAEEIRHVITQLQGEWTLHNIKTTMIKDCLEDLTDKYKESVCKTEIDDAHIETSDKDIMSYTDCLTLGVEPKNYTPLLERQTCSSLEDRIQHYKKRRKLQDSEENVCSSVNK